MDEKTLQTTIILRNDLTTRLSALEAFLNEDGCKIVLVKK